MDACLAAWRCGLSSAGRPRFRQLRQHGRGADDGVGDGAELPVVAAGIVAKEGESDVAAYRAGLGDGAFGLLDDDAGVQGAL